jgi:homogentisate 1,2-dioxygenase
MPIYQRRGEIPRKRHIIFRNSSGSLYAEELIGNEGFSGISSLLYHLYQPTKVKAVSHLKTLNWGVEEKAYLRPRHFKTGSIKRSNSFTLDRTPLLFNQDVAILAVRPNSQDDFFYRNAQADELIYVSDGTGVLESQFGELQYRKGDYLVIPRGVLYRLRFSAGLSSFLVVESNGYIRTPKRYRNQHGQLMESAPYSERDIRVPENLSTVDQMGEFITVVKRENTLTQIVLDHNPLDVVGWDGYYYPWAFNIEDFEPRVGRVHLPPPVHQTFESDGFVVCSFCPRPYDFDEQAVPVPYNHSNVMSDEVIFYASSEFMSRKGVEYGSITFHPDGMPHGPQPGKTEESLGKKYTNELAVMVDTFRPLKVSADASGIEEADYFRSWFDS